MLETCLLYQCPGDAGASADVKTSARESFNYGTRIIRHSGNGRQHASNATAVPVHRDVSHPRSEITSSQREAFDPFPARKMSDNAYGPFGNHALSRGEHIKPSVQTDNSVNRPESSSANGVDPTKLADSMVSWFSTVDSKKQAAARKYGAADESATFETQRKDSRGAVGYLRYDASSDFTGKPVQDSAAASVVGYRQSSTAPDRELSFVSGRSRQHCGGAPNDQPRRDTVTSRRDPQWHHQCQQFAEAEGSVTDNSFRRGDVTKSAKPPAWSSAGTSHRGTHVLLYLFVTRTLCRHLSAGVDVLFAQSCTILKYLLTLRAEN